VNYALNLLAERRLGQRWHLSALSGWQLLDLRDAAGTSHVSSLTDSFLSARYAVPVSWGALSAITSVKVPGTYPESSLTSTKQLDAEVGGLATIAAWSRATFVIGAGYKVRFGGVQDEVTATVLVPVRVVDRLSITPLLVGAVPIGIGEVARNSVTAGGSLAFRLTSAVELSAAYYRTVLGRNVALSYPPEHPRVAHVIGAGDPRRSLTEGDDGRREAAALDQPGGGLRDERPEPARVR
jgi:hypothetical protein